MKSEKQNIFNYSDYRAFMLSFYEAEKERWSDFSYNVWARQLDLKNNTSIIKIIKGQRNAGAEMVTKLSKYFSFNEKEHEYFEGLVRISKIKDDDRLKVMLMRDLQKLNHKNKQILLDESKFNTISSVWCFTLRQLAKLGFLSSDFEKLQGVLVEKLPLRRLKGHVKDLLELDMLEQDKDIFSCTSNSINTSDDIANEALKAFHEEALELAKKSIRNIEPEEREISGLTFSFDQKEILEAKEMIRDFQDQFVARFGGKKTGSHIYQMQTQLFPLTQKLNKEYKNEELH